MSIPLRNGFFFLRVLLIAARDLPRIRHAPLVLKIYARLDFRFSSAKLDPSHCGFPLRGTSLGRGGECSRPQFSHGSCWPRQTPQLPHNPVLGPAVILRNLSPLSGSIHFLPKRSTKRTSPSPSTHPPCLLRTTGRAIQVVTREEKGGGG